MGVLLLLVCAFTTAASQCEFPSTLEGNWTTTRIGDLIISNSTIASFPVGAFGNFDFDCHEEYDGRYIVKSQSSLVVFGVNMNIYMCFDFTFVSSNLYYYYLASNETSGVQAIFRPQWNSLIADIVCAQSPSQYDAVSFEIMIRDGDGEAAKQPCPTNLVASWRYEIDNGTGISCSAAGRLEGCTSSQFTVNYTTCNTRTFYSNVGQVYCLASVTSGSVTYLIVSNNDSSVDSITTHSLTCLVYEETGTGINMTQFPGKCDTGQTANDVSVPDGSYITLFNTTACPVEVVSTDYTLYIIVGAVCGLLLLFMLVVFFIIFCHWKAKQKAFRGRLGPEVPDEKTNRLQAFENGFKRIKHPGELDKPLDREGSPEQEDDTPINVMHLLRKDIITPGGRDSPSSQVVLSVSTPNPYSFHDGDSVGGGSLPIPHENPALKKHYHVIGGEPSVGELEEGEDDNFSGEPDGAPVHQKRGNSGHRTGSGRRVGSGQRVGSGRNTNTPVMVMPVKSDGSDAFDADDDDLSDDALFETDEDAQRAIAAARHGVGLNGSMCPPPRLPPIDEGPASHRSITGAGNKRLGRRRRPGGAPIVGWTAPMTADGEGGQQNPAIAEDEEPTTATMKDRSTAAVAAGDVGDDVGGGRCDAGGARDAAERVPYLKEGSLVVAFPDIVEQVDMGSGTVENKADDRWAYENNKESMEGGRLKPQTLTADRRHNSELKSATSTSANARRRVPGRSRKGKMKYADDEDSRPKSRVKMTRVDIPELLPPGEKEIQPPSENELTEMPGPAFHNAAYRNDKDDETNGAKGRDPADQDGKQHGELATSSGSGPASRRKWPKADSSSPDVWNQVSQLWRKAMTSTEKQQQQQQQQTARATDATGSSGV